MTQPDAGVLALLEHLGRYYNSSTFAEAEIRNRGFRRVLSVGEGNGEYAVALACKLPDVRIVAFDLDAGRVARGRTLSALVGVRNVVFVVADAAQMPFRTDAFDFIYERGVFHVLADKQRHLDEIRRLAPSALLLTEIANGRWYERNWWLCRLLLGALGTRRVDLVGQRQTVAYLRRIGAYRDWKYYKELLIRAGMSEVRPIWHDFFVKRSYWREFPAIAGRRSAAFGLFALLRPPTA